MTPKTPEAPAGAAGEVALESVWESVVGVACKLWYNRCHRNLHKTREVRHEPARDDSRASYD